MLILSAPGRTSLAQLKCRNLLLSPLAPEFPRIGQELWGKAVKMGRVVKRVILARLVVCIWPLCHLRMPQERFDLAKPTIIACGNSGGFCVGIPRMALRFRESI